MDFTFNFESKEIVKKVYFVKEELIESLIKMKEFLIVYSAGLTLRLILTIYSEEETIENKFKSCFFVLLFYSLAFITNFLCFPKIRSLSNSNEYSFNQNLFKAQNLFFCISLFYSIFASLGLILMVIYPIQDNFLRGASLTISFCVTNYFCGLILRDMKVVSILYAINFVFIYFLFAKTPMDLELGAKLLVANGISFLKVWQSYQERKSKSGKFIEEIFDKNNIFKQFLQGISDAILLKSLNNNVLDFQNQKFNELKLNTVNFTINDKNLINQDHNETLSLMVSQLIKKKLDEKQEKLYFNENFTLNLINSVKVFSIFSMKIIK